MANAFPWPASRTEYHAFFLATLLSHPGNQAVEVNAVGCRQHKARNLHLAEQRAMGTNCA
jgi:hypothetical protein